MASRHSGSGEAVSLGLFEESEQIGSGSDQLALSPSLADLVDAAVPGPAARQRSGGMRCAPLDAMALRKRRLVLGVLAIPLAVFLYRALTVYTIRGMECRPRPVDSSLRREAPPRLRVMTYNIAGHDELIDGDHLRHIAEVIRRLRPDVVALQEVHRGTWQARFRDQLAELEALTGLDGRFAPSYVQWGAGYGNAILTRGRILEAKVHPLPCMGEPRSLLEATILIAGGTVSFYSTHLTAWGGLNSARRAEQLECLERVVRTSPHPYILAGDLNTSPDSPEMRAFRRKDAARLATRGIGPTYPSLGQQLDYLFVDPGWQVRNPRTWPIEASDHLPVTAELVWERATSSPSATAEQQTVAPPSLFSQLSPLRTLPSNGRWHPAGRHARERRLPGPWQPLSWSPK